MTREPDPTGFDAIVASWRAEGNVPEWPDDLRLDDDTHRRRRRMIPRPTRAPRQTHGDRPDAPGPAGVEGPPLGRHPTGSLPTIPAPTLPARRTATGPTPHRTRPTPTATPGTRHRAAAPTPPPRTAPTGATHRAASAATWPTRRRSLAEEHFVPPDPPPLPRMGPPILIGLTLITLGLIL